MAGTRIPDDFAKSGGFAKSDIAGKAGIQATQSISQKASGGTQANPPVKSNPALLNTFPQNRIPGNQPGTLNERGAATQQTIFARELFKQTAANMGFPKDTLSVALMAFSRFFSIPPNNALIGALRREILSQPKNSQETGKNLTEAKAMALLSAADKGVTLQPEALEHYAGFFVSPDGEKQHRQERKDAPEQEELKIIAESEAQEDPLLDVLNSLPGKNGQYWLVFPLNINVRGTELKIFLRILKREHGSVLDRLSGGEDDQLIADISAPKRQWRCFLKKAGGKFSADILVYPECGEKTLSFLQKKAERLLGKNGGLPWLKAAGNFCGFEEIQVRNGEGFSSMADYMGAEILPVVDEEV